MASIKCRGRKLLWLDIKQFLRLLPEYLRKEIISQKLLETYLMKIWRGDKMIKVNKINESRQIRNFIISNIERDVKEAEIC